MTLCSECHSEQTDKQAQQKRFIFPTFNFLTENQYARY
jgi:hypothetical protein